MPAKGPGKSAISSPHTGTPIARYPSTLRFALIIRPPTCGASRCRACCTKGTPRKGCIPLSMPPMRLPRPPARISPVMSLLSIDTIASCHRTLRERTIESLDVNALVLGPRAQTLKPVDNAPQLSRATTELLCEAAIVDDRGEQRSLRLPIERALRVMLDDRELVTLMTLGAAPEWLIIGYLRNQRVIDRIDALESVIVDWSSGAARVRSHVGERAAAALSSPLARSGCALGSAFGDPMHAIEGLDFAAASEARISRSVL